MTDTRVDLAIAGSCVRVVQVTDTHLEERRGGTLLGMDTDASLAHVLDLVRDAPLRPDLLLATGDQVQHLERGFDMLRLHPAAADVLRRRRHGGITGVEIHLVEVFDLARIHGLV